MSNPSAIAFEIEVLLIAVLFVSFLAAGAYFAIPESLRRLALRSAFRLDGSFSERRQRIERWHLLKFVGEAISGPLLLILPVLLCGFLLHERVIPYHIARAAVSEFQVDEEAWRTRAEASVRREHAAWAEERGYDRNAVTQMQRFMWKSWALIVLTGVVAAIAAWVAMLKYLGRLIREYEAALMARCHGYRFTDWSRGAGI